MQSNALMCLACCWLLLSGLLPPLSSGQKTNRQTEKQTTTLRLFEELPAQEASLLTSWRNNDVPSFQTASTTSLAVSMPKAVAQIGAEITSVLGNLGKVFSPIFAIFSIVAEVIGSTVFSQDKQFAELYGFLQDNFVKVYGMMETISHVIQDLQSEVKCGEALSQEKQFKTQISAFYNRYLIMIKRAQNDPVGARAVFEFEFSQYQSTKMLLEFHHLLSDSELYAKILNHCAKGSAPVFLRIIMELLHTFIKAIILDSVAKIRLQTNKITKQALNSDRTYWKNQVTYVANLMDQTASDLVTRSWHSFYQSDIDRSLSSSSSDTALNAAGKLSHLLTLNYPYVRTAVMIAPWDTKTIAITDAFGSAIVSVSKDSFVCYHKNRANGGGKLEPVIVLCRNTIVYPNEQSELDSFYANYRRGKHSLSLPDALRNHHLEDILNIMGENSVSFFAVKVEIHLNSGSVSYVQPSDLVFFDSSCPTKFRALVIAKLIKVKTPNSIVYTCAASSIQVRWSVAGVLAAIVSLSKYLHL